MVKLTVYSAKGVKKGSTNLPERFVGKENLPLLAQAIRVYEDRLHPVRGKTKTRGEVKSSGAKIWRQKGTGRARHGDVGAPIFVGGGIAHGPRGIKRKLNLPKKLGKQALVEALSLKAKEGHLVIVENLAAFKKTKEAKRFLEVISDRVLGGKSSKVTIAQAGDKGGFAFRNIKDIQVLSFSNLNAYKILQGGLLIVDKEALSTTKATQKKLPKTPSQIKSVQKPRVAIRTQKRKREAAKPKVVKSKGRKNE